jgi:sulfate-transporting ATPase
VQFASFDVFGSILLVQYAVIGGLGWIAGAVIGASAAPGAVVAEVTARVLPNLDNIAAWLVIASGIGVVQLLRRAPDGVASVVSSRLRRLRPQRPARATQARSRPEDADIGARGRTLEVRSVSVHFGGLAAVDDVSFIVSPGEVVGLIGPNGAGKTTLLDLMTGFTRLRHGRVLLDGIDVSSWSPERRARAGISRSWQGVELFEELTVWENLLVAQETRSRWRYLRDLVWRTAPSLSAFGESVVDDLGLRDALDEKPHTLSLGLLKLVGIARTIIAQPGVILLDEPAAGLDAEDSRELAELIRRIARTHQVAIVVIEHDMALILNTCDRIAVLDFGRKIADGTPEEIQQDPRVVDAYLGAPTKAEPVEQDIAAR